jgi:hypothetical protein
VLDFYGFAKLPPISVDNFVDITDLACLRLAKYAYLSDCL